MSPYDQYKNERSWHGRVIIMELYHLSMIIRHGRWPISKTAQQFSCSIGLTSENLKLAEAFHRDADLMNCGTRQEALDKLRQWR